MKHTVKMLKSQNVMMDGQPPRMPVLLEEGKEYEIGDDLLQSLVNDGAVELVNPVEKREKKVVTPAEVKEETTEAPTEAPTKAVDLTKMKKAELIAYALNEHGLELSPDNMTNKEIIAAIEAAK